MTVPRLVVGLAEDPDSGQLTSEVDSSHLIVS
jgi:hypothetical protein